MFLKILVLLMAVLFSVSARADLITTDGWVLGDASLTRDTATGLDWLDLSATNNRSYNDLLVNSSALSDLGFRPATISEVTALFFDAGGLTISTGTSVPSNTAADLAAASKIISLFGCTACGTNFFSEGMVFSVSLAERFFYAQSNVAPFLGANDIDQILFPNSLNFHQVGSGIFLVKSSPAIDHLFTGTEPTPDLPISAAVPEPATWAMLLIGFAGIGFVSYRKSRRGKFIATTPVCTENLIRVDDVMESPKLAE